MVCAKLKYSYICWGDPAIIEVKFRIFESNQQQPTSVFIQTAGSDIYDQDKYSIAVIIIIILSFANKLNKKICISI